MKKLFVIMFVMLFAVTSCKQRGGGAQQESVQQAESVQPQENQRGGAQQRGGRNLGTAEERAKVQTDRLADLVALTADQKTKIEAIEVDIQKQLDERRQNLQGNTEALRAISREIETVREEKYKSVLTADQLKKYTEDREQRRERAAQGGERQGGGQRGN